MANYVIMLGGNYLAKRSGWGPTFTPEQTDAKRFQTISEAYEYRRNNLGGMDCKIAKIGLYFNPPTYIC